MSDAEPTPGSETPSAGTGDGVRRLTWVVAAVTLVVIVAGANVTSSASGDAIPTWPWGWFADDVPTAIEMSHRVVAGALVAGSLALAAAAWATRSRGLRRLAVFALGTVVVQAVVGGIRVLYPETEFKVLHGVLGQLFFGVAAAAVCITSRWWRDTVERPLEDAALQMLRASAFALAALVLQLILGALGRHDVLPREVHSIFAIVPMVLVARIVLVASSDLPRGVELFRGVSAGLGFLTAVQLVLGISAYIVSSDAPDPAARGVFQLVVLDAHVAAGAATMGLVISTLLRTVRLWGLPTDERVAEARRSAEGGGR